MSNFLRNLGQIAGVAGKAIQGYGIDRENKVKQAMLKAREDRDAEQQRLQGLLTQSNISQNEFQRGAPERDAERRRAEAAALAEQRVAQQKAAHKRITERFGEKEAGAFDPNFDYSSIYDNLLTSDRSAASSASADERAIRGQQAADARAAAAAAGANPPNPITRDGVDPATGQPAVFQWDASGKRWEVRPEMSPKPTGGGAVSDAQRLGQISATLGVQGGGGRSTGGSTPPPVVDESAMSPADLWEKKVKDGMSGADATAYVNRVRKR